MKSFKSYIKEENRGLSRMGSVGVGTTHSQAVDMNINPAAISNPNVVRRLNAYVGAIANMEYMLPEHALNKLKEKLGRVGLSFDCQLEGDKGSKTIEVKQFGGRFGKDTDGSDINDDGISHKKEGGLKIEVSHELLQTGTSKVYAKLV